MAKKKTIGTRRFTKRTVYEYDPNKKEDLKLMVQHTHEFNSGQMSFEKRIQQHADLARKLLVSKDLPVSVKMFQIEYPDNTVKWEPSIPPEGKRVGALVLTEYLKSLGFHHDSTECIAAKIIFKVQKYFNPETDENQKPPLAYDIAVLATLANVYMHEERRLKANAKSPRSKLTSIIKKLSKRDGTPKELWYSLITIMDNEDLEPEESKDQNGKPIIHYWKDNKSQGYIKYKRFSDRLAEFRNKSR